MSEQTGRFAKWIGNTERTDDEVTLAPTLAAAATLDDTDSMFKTGAALPPLWHWFYFLPKAPQSKLGPDGHPQRGAFMPPIELPRRMFAGARLRFLKPLVIGKPARREATILDVSEKSGASGTLAFVTVGYRFVQDGEECVVEEQDIVYREPGAPVSAPEPAELPPLPAGAWSRTIVPDPRLLFRFSALTFNGHRIHYDRDYTMNKEGYPGLVVHGPLTAVLLMELVRRNADRPATGFAFRGRAPLFDLAPFRLVGISGDDGAIALEAQGPDGKAAMTATAELA